MVNNEHPVSRWCCSDNAILAIVKSSKVRWEINIGVKSAMIVRGKFPLANVMFNDKKGWNQDCGAASHREPAGLRGASDEGRIGGQARSVVPPKAP
jgi:hypothetical protein